MTAATVELSGLLGKPVELGAEAIQKFGASLDGPLLRPRDEGFNDAALVWNGMIQKRPALIVQPTNTEDVVAAVTFARDHGLLLSIKGGGHNIAGTSLAEGGLTLDMSRMKRVEVDAGARLVRVGPGCLLQDVDRVTQEHGLAAALGFVSETGVAGLTLGGGFGYLTRRFGWTVDDLEEVEIVTPDGEVRRASRDAHEDLFWALRGGGGNFGVVTDFTFRLHQVGPQITGGLIAWPAAQAEDLLALYRTVTERAPRQLTLVVTMRLAPPAPFVPVAWHGKPIIAMVACHSGDPIQAAEDLADIRGFGEPIMDLITTKPYLEQQSMLNATQPKGMHYYWKSEFVTDLPDGLLQTYRAQATEIASPLSQIVFFHVAGALNERSEADGAVGNRDAGYVCNVAGAWRPDDTKGEVHRGWVRTAWEAIRPYSTGGNYVNFQTADEGAERTEAAYRGNFDRLAKVKSAYDPDNLFRLNRNVSPAT